MSFNGSSKVTPRGKAGWDVRVPGSSGGIYPSPTLFTGDQSGPGRERAGLKVAQGHHGRTKTVTVIGHCGSPRTVQFLWPFRMSWLTCDCHLCFSTGFSLHSQALLDLGGSPNYKDRRGLTPLFHTAMVGGDPRCCELLLYNRAQLGIADENGWQEIHQVLLIHAMKGWGGGPSL